MNNDVNQLKEEVKELRDCMTITVNILEMLYKHMSTISHSCNCLKEDLETAVASDLLNINDDIDNKNQNQ